MVAKKMCEDWFVVIEVEQKKMGKQQRVFVANIHYCVERSEVVF
jgi:hypothetical protein